MNNKEQKQLATKFANKWKDRGYEKGEAQVFWLELLRDVLGVENVTDYITFEDQVHIDKSTGFIDAYISSTRILIEQKSIGKDLRTPIKQSDGSLLTPFQQAKKYIAELPLSKHPKWVITSNFESFLIYDMEKPTGEPEEIFLKDLPKEYYRLSFIIDKENEHLKKEKELSIKAGELVGLIYNAFANEYKDLSNIHSQQSLNKLCVRLVFCLYAEDAGLFGKKYAFHDYLKKFDINQIRNALIRLFNILNTKYEDRDPYLEDDLAQFPYVNGGLFENDEIEIPTFTEEIKEILLSRASDDFDWSEISPTIFGAIFESTLNPETRRSGGMHYTSIENIHKVIDPLFLSDLKEELNQIKQYKQEKIRNEKYLEFQNKISKLTFLDPACGSGNFLTETYIQLRKLENELLEDYHKNKITLGFEDDVHNPIKVNIHQFYGIEVNDFAVSVAETALWIAESQMLKETEEIVNQQLNFFPLENYSNIIEGNALRMDWNDVIPKNELNYIMGNPPFIGKKFQSLDQKTDLINIFGEKFRGVGAIDYVSGWFKKSIDYTRNTKIETALVTTSSLTQGEQVPILWPFFLLDDLSINFAHQTFRWDNGESDKAKVHCVIIGFAHFAREIKKIFSNGTQKNVDNINPYLNDAPTVIIENRTVPISNVKEMTDGNVPIDGNHLKLEPNEYEEFKANEPNSLKYIKKLVGSDEFINKKDRYVLWLVDCPPDELRNMPMVLDRVNKVRQFRLESTRESTLKMADFPAIYENTRNPDNALIIPRVSSEKRKYIPMGFIDKDTIALNAVVMIPNADTYDFGILTSNVHMAWMRFFAGRLKSDYRYSKAIVYNNFPWPDVSAEQKKNIELTAQGILDARELYPNSTLADLYDEVTMPPELRKAHQENDKAVMKAYGFSLKMTESECVAELMKMYQKLVNKE